MLKTQEELGEELCKYCSYTEYSTKKVNTGPWNLCEGSRCKEAYDRYCEDQEGEEWPPACSPFVIVPSMTWQASKNKSNQR